MKCEHCAAALTIYSFQQRASGEKPQNIRCPRCGSSHSLLRGQVDAINPRPLPIGNGAKRMPWRDASTRPIDAGSYECRFRDTEPRILTLSWDGAAFTYEGKRVQMRTLMAWRGEWEA